MNARILIAVFTAILSACGSDSTGSASTSQLKSASYSIWQSAASDTGAPLRDQSFRTIVSPRGEASAVRLRFSNLFGTTDLVIESVRLAEQLSGAQIDPNAQRVVTFQEQESIRIAPGQTVLSDEVNFAIEPFKKLAVSYHVRGESPNPTRHFFGNQTSYLSLSGVGSQSDSGQAADFPIETTEVYFLTALEARGNRPSEVIVAIGDSITDGFVGSNLGVFVPDTTSTDQDQRYPDFLARRLLDQSNASKQYVVVQTGISGNRLLSDAMLGFPRFGPSMLSRLTRDVLQVAGVKTVIILIGTNDLGLLIPTTAQPIINGLRTAITTLKSAGLNVLIGTQTPSEGLVLVSGHGTPLAIAARRQINEWIRSQNLADGFIDFATALADPNNPDALATEFDSGDGLHPSISGYRAMADAIDLQLLMRPD